MANISPEMSEIMTKNNKKSAGERYFLINSYLTF